MDIIWTFENDFLSACVDARRLIV